MNLIRDQHEVSRFACLVRAACTLAHEINTTPGLDGTTVAREYEALFRGDAPRDYLDDLEARCGVRVDEARVFWRLAAEIPEDEFADFWHTVQSRYTMPRVKA
jgi:hypothetical protein